MWKRDVTPLHGRYNTETKSLRESLKPAMLEARAARQKGDTAAARTVLERTKADREKLRAVMQRQKVDFRGADARASEATRRKRQAGRWTAGQREEDKGR